MRRHNGVAVHARIASRGRHHRHPLRQPFLSAKWASFEFRTSTHTHTHTHNPNVHLFFRTIHTQLAAKVKVRIFRALIAVFLFPGILAPRHKALPLCIVEQSRVSLMKNVEKKFRVIISKCSEEVLRTFWGAKCVNTRYRANTQCSQCVIWTFPAAAFLVSVSWQDRTFMNFTSVCACARVVCEQYVCGCVRTKTHQMGCTLELEKNR